MSEENYAEKKYCGNGAATKGECQVNTTPFQNTLHVSRNMHTTNYGPLLYNFQCVTRVRNIHNNMADVMMLRTCKLYSYTELLICAVRNPNKQLRVTE